jgi:hypothetical protein
MQEEAGEPTYGAISQLGKRCQVDLLGLGFNPGLVLLGFSYKKLYSKVDTIQLHELKPFL